MATKTCELYFAINSDGDYVVSVEDDAIELLENEVGLGDAVRTAKLFVTIAVPQAATVAISVPDDAGAVKIAAE